MNVENGHRSTSQLNLKGKAIGLVGRYLGSEQLQSLLNKIEMIVHAGMNIGGATMSCEQNGELNVMKFVRKHYSHEEKLVLFDVGAHEGEYSKLLADVFGENTSIFCFEPSLDLFRVLEKNIGGNGIEPNNLGLSDVNEKIHLFSANDRIPTAVIEAFDVVGQEMVSEEVIHCVRLDSFCSDKNIKRINFLKVDVEGYELKVLRGAGDLLAENIDFVQFEFGQHSVASRTFFYDFYCLLNPSFRIYRVLRSGLVELKKYNTRLEQFSSATNYLAVSRSRFMS